MVQYIVQLIHGFWTDALGSTGLSIGHFTNSTLWSFVGMLSSIARQRLSLMRRRTRRATRDRCALRNGANVASGEKVFLFRNLDTGMMALLEK